MIISGAVMILTFIGVIICYRKHKKKKVAAALPGAIIMLLGLLVSSFMFLYQWGIIGSAPEQRFRNREMGYKELQGFYPAKYLAEKFPSYRALLIAPEGYEEDSYNKEIIEGIKKGFGDSIELAAIETIWAPGGDETKINAASFNTIIKANDDCNLIISMIGLPPDINRLVIWREKARNRPKLVAYNIDVKRLRKYIARKFITAAVLFRPDPEITDRMPHDPEDAFNQRYILVTPANIGSKAGLYPRLF